MPNAPRANEKPNRGDGHHGDAAHGPTRQALLDALRKHTGKEPILTERTDSSLIGGLVLHAGDERIDFSVQRKLAGLRSTLFARASREIHSGRTYFEES